MVLSRKSMIRPSSSIQSGWDNARRSFTCWLVAVADADGEYKGAVQPIRIDIPKDVVNRVK